MKKKLVNIRDIRKKGKTYHSLASADVLPSSRELSDDELDLVCGGMSREVYEEWRANFINSLAKIIDQ